MLGKLGNLEMAQSTEYLTAILNGFKMEAEDAIDVVNKLIAVDNIAATSSAEIATALQYSSAVANDVGVSFENLVAMLTTVSSTTRLSAEMIGTAFRTMFIRMQQVKAGEIDETGMSLNNVEKSLSNVGIALRDATDSFRPLEDVIADVAGVWGTLDEVTKAQIANAIAGQRQAQIFSALMQNYGDVQKYVTAETDSAGLAQDRYAIYLQGVEAAQTRVTAATEEFWQKTISSGAITDFYNFIAGVISLTTALGGLQTIVVTATIALLLFNKVSAAGNLKSLILNILMLAQRFGVLTTSVAASATVMEFFNTTNPIGWIALAIAAIYGLTKAYDVFNVTIEETDQKIAELKDKIKSLQQVQKDSTDLITEFKDLSKKSPQDRTDDENQRFIDVQNELKELLPDLIGYYDQYGNFIADATQDMKALTDATEEQIIKANDLKRQQEDDSAEKRVKNLLDMYLKLAYAQSNGIYGKSNEQVIEINADYTDALNSSKRAFEQMSKEGQQAFVDALKESGPQGEKLANDIFIPLMNKIDELKANPPTITIEADVKVVSEESQKAFEDLVDATIDMIKQINEAQKDALQDQLDDLEDVHNAQQDIYDAELDAIKRNADERKEALDREFDEQKRIYDQQRKAIEYQIESYNRIIDAEKDRLRIAKEAADFQDNQSEKTDALADLESEIAELSLDNSEEAVAKRMQLEEQAADLRKEIADDAADYEYQLQIEALDAEATAAEEEANKRLEEMEAEFEQYEYQHQLEIQAIEDAQQNAEEHYRIVTENLDAEYEAQKQALQNQIDAIDDYLDQEGTLRRDALAMIMDDNSTLYEDLLAWNEKYGTGINEDITKMWELARDAVEAYSAAVLAAPPAPMPDTGYITPTGEYGTMPGEVHHEGVHSGFVGGSATMRSNEQFAKLLNGELVVNSSQMDSFMTKILPSLMKQSPTAVSNFNGGGINVSMPITIGGSLDRSVMPDLEAMVNKAMEKLNSALMSRGYNRGVSSYSI